MNFQKWIKDTGVVKVAKMLDVNVSTVGQWSVGYVLPRDPIKMKIVALTKGKVSYKSMIEYHYSAANSANRFQS